MSDRKTMSDEAIAWATQELAKAVKQVTEHGVIDSPMLESRPAWMHPFDVVVGQVRDQGQQSEFLWLIGGSVPVDWIHSEVAATARDALRHFALRWQLEAARYEDPANRTHPGLDAVTDWDERIKTLITKAEYLYSLAEDGNLWR